MDSYFTSAEKGRYGSKWNGYCKTKIIEGTITALPKKRGLQRMPIKKPKIVWDTK